MQRISVGLLFLTASLYAQNAQPRPYVRASGDATVSVRPDQAKITASVVTSGNTAQEAADKNATMMTNVIAQLRTVVGNSPDIIKSTGYSVYPVTRTVNGNTLVTSYTAQNTVEVTLGNILLASRVIDTAIAAGATNIGSLLFGLADPNPSRVEALKKAAQLARLKAEAIVSALGLRLGNITVLEESGGIGIRSFAVGAATTAATPVQPGLVDVSATVTLQADII